MHLSEKNYGMPVLLFTLAILNPAARADQADAGKISQPTARQLQEELKHQQERIGQLELLVKQQGLLLEKLQERLLDQSRVSAPLPAAGAAEHRDTVSGPPTQAEAQSYAAKAEALSGKVDGILKSVGGFQFSGDFRYRTDVAVRSGNSAAGPVQNIRARYRLRFNIDKELDPRFRFHAQLATGPLNNGITNDQDFAATVAKHVPLISEAWIDYHPVSSFALRVGRMEEVFADNSRFLWDDDVRFNGFQQIARVQLRTNAMGLKEIEFRAGEYILSNPNIAILSANSPFVLAGLEPGKRVPAANLFDPGAILRGSLGDKWSHQLTVDFPIYRNPNQIQLASVVTGNVVMIDRSLGIALAGPMTGTGNATTTQGGAIYSAPNFQIARLAYRLETKALRFGDRAIPAWFDVQVSRNTGTGRLRDALMATMNLGAVKGAGDMRFLYQFAIKDANALISQFTDDDLGTGSGVNLATHGLRFDVGIARFLQFQNLFFIQNQRRASDPSDQFFVPLPRGAGTTFRYQGQFAFTF